MTIYSAVLFVHIVSVVVLTAVLGFEWLRMSQLRRASSAAEVGDWISLVPQLPAIAIASMLLLLLTGVYLTVQLQAWVLAWPKVSFLSLLSLAPLGSASGRRTRALRASMKGQPALDMEQLKRRISDPVLSLSLGLRTAVVLAVILIMTAKPTLEVCLAILAVALLMGLFLGWRRASDSMLTALSQQG
jgi:hypothetical protein